jgi:hypothetical protein
VSLTTPPSRYTIIALPTNLLRERNPQRDMHFGNRYSVLADHHDEPDNIQADEQSEVSGTSSRSSASHSKVKRPRRRGGNSQSSQMTTEELDKEILSFMEADTGKEGWDDQSLSALLGDDPAPYSATLSDAFRSMANSVSATVRNLQSAKRTTSGRGGGVRHQGVSQDNIGGMRDNTSKPQVTFQSSPAPSTVPVKPVLTTVLPNQDSDESKKASTFFTYKAQLTFGLQRGREVNMAILFSKFLANAIKLVPLFSLLPYNDNKGLKISFTTQPPEDNPDFYQTYYKNHRILQHRNLTSMISFQCGASWTMLKKPTCKFFRFLCTNKIFLYQTRINAATLVAIGFLHGAHPGYFRRDAAEQEMEKYINQNPASRLPFQLSARTITVPITDGKAERFSFQAVVVETAVEHATDLREQFYSLGNPAIVKRHFSYTGNHQFIPLLKSNHWPINKIWRLAKAHKLIVTGLKPIFLEHLQDLDTKINDHVTLRDGFLGMLHIDRDESGKEINRQPLLHSIHNTGSKTIKVVLVPTKLYDSTVHQLSIIHHTLKTYIPQEHHDKVFVGDNIVGISGQKADTVTSCSSSAYADRLLSGFNPQDGEDIPTIPAPKRYHTRLLSYVSVASSSVSHSEITHVEPTPTTPLPISDSEFETLYNRLLIRLSSSTFTTPMVSTEDLERYFTSCQSDIANIHSDLTSAISSI